MPKQNRPVVAFACEFLLTNTEGWDGEPGFHECGRTASHVIEAGVELGNDQPFFACDRHGQDLHDELAGMEAFTRVGPVMKLDYAPDGEPEPGRWYVL